MNHLLNICNINGAEVESYPIAVTKMRFKEDEQNYFKYYCEWCWGHGFGNCDKCKEALEKRLKEMEG